MQRNLNDVNLLTPLPPSTVLMPRLYGTGREREREKKGGKREPPPAAADFLRSFNAAIIGIRLGRVYVCVHVCVDLSCRVQVSGNVLATGTTGLCAEYEVVVTNVHACR